MKRALFITHYMPPRPGIGSVRTGQIVRYLPDYGWEVTVLTARLQGHSYDGLHVVETPSVHVSRAIKNALGIRNRVTHEVLRTAPAMYDARKNFRQRAIETAHRACAYATNRFGWYAGGIADARKLVEAGRFDVVLSTSPPESAHVLASAVATHVPWVADFRDLWVGNSAATGFIYDRLDRIFEPVFMRRARSLVTVSPGLASVLERRYGKPVFCIPNAFDAAEWADVPFGRERRCTVLYAGNFYDGRRDPRPMFEAAKQLLQSGAITPAQLEISIYTTPQPWLFDLVAESGLQDVVSIHPIASRERIMQLERRADLLWVLLFDGDADAGVLTGKLFEYLGARRPIVVTGGPADCALDDVLAKTGVGTRPRSVAAIADTLLEAVRRHEGNVPELSPKLAAVYEAHELARRFAGVLDDAAGVSRETTPPLASLVG